MHVVRHRSPRSKAHAKLAITPENPTVRNLFRKKELLEKRDARHKEIRPLLIILGGGMRGVSGGGAVTALNLLGLNRVFDIAIGASAGADIAAYFLAGTEQTFLGTSLFYDELRGKQFINPMRLSEVANVERLQHVFSKGPKRLDVDAVLANRTHLYIALTDFIDGTTQLYDAKQCPESIVKMLTISSAIPFLYRKRLTFDGRQYLDGSVAFSVRRTLESSLVRSYKPTDLLLITNTEELQASSEDYQWMERAAVVFSHHFERLLLRRIQLHDDLEYLADIIDHLNIGVIASPTLGTNVGNLTTDPQKLWKLGDKTLQYTLKGFGRPDLYQPLREPAERITD